ncbi:ATP synthase subunit b, mitochondrial [Venturia canescens]|uniref:ATP synthase subunit b, mitochondrial n=1 Tax=Venturia canescens TaxID=32260 RepID=UPI001C9C39A1|nr:ATP synthase subunit b, mitochondrial [Venturia canescens]
MLSRLALKNAQALPPMVRSAPCMSTLLPGFERRQRPIDPSPVRHAFIPEGWFTMFYPKTGVTGPYMFGGGVATYLVSKEIYVLEHEFYTGVSILIMFVYGAKKFGPMLAEYLDKKLDAEEAEYAEVRNHQIQSCEDAIANEKKQQWRSEVQQLIIDAKKENVLMQLEATYRERIAMVATEVKKRLDYQTQIAHVERRLAQRHMAQWIINNVMKAITPEQEKASLQQCIKDLQALSTRA